MKTRINLYLPEFRPAKELLTLSRVVLICFIVLLLMIGWVFAARASTASQMKENQRLQDQITQLEEQINLMQERILAMHTNGDLKAELERAKKRYKSLQVIISALKNIKADNAILYSSLMMELAEACSSRMAIEKIVATGKVVNIEGKVIGGNEVPSFIERFKQLDVLHQLSFASIEVGRANEEDNSSPMSFKLTGYNPQLEKNSEQNSETDDEENVEENVEESDNE